MEKAIKDIDVTEQELTISLTKSEIAPYYENAYKKLLPDLNIKGFRKGKAPLNLVKRMYGKAIEQDAEPDIFNEFLNKIIKEDKIHIVGEPHIHDINYDDDKVSCTIHYDYIPEFELKDYKGLTIDEPVHTLTEAEIDEYIKGILKHNGEFVEADRVENEDYVVGLNLKEVDKQTHVSIIGGEDKEVQVYLADRTVLPGLRDNIIGNGVGDYFYFTPKSEDEFSPDKTFEVRILDIQKLVPAELTDEFVMKYTSEKLQTIEDFRTDASYKLQEAWDSRSKEYMENKIVERLVTASEIHLPYSAVYAMVDGMVEDLKERYKDQPGAKDLNADNMFTDLNGSARRIIKWELIRNKIAELEDIKAEDYDVESIADAESKRYKTDKDTLIKKLLENPQVRNNIINKKVIDLLLGFAITNEISFDEIASRDEAALDEEIKSEEMLQKAHEHHHLHEHEDEHEHTH